MYSAMEYNMKLRIIIKALFQLQFFFLCHIKPIARCFSYSVSTLQTVSIPANMENTSLPFKFEHNCVK